MCGDIWFRRDAHDIALKAHPDTTSGSTAIYRFAGEGLGNRIVS